MSRNSDFRRPFIDLLDRVAISARDDATAYARIRLRLTEVRHWFSDRTGWMVVCTRDVARLVKTPSLPGSGQGFGWVQQPLDYELTAWLLWYSEVIGSEVFLLTQAVTEIEARANELIGPGHINWDSYAQRLSLGRALRGLDTMGAIHRLDGSSEQWVSDQTGNTLYEFTPLVRHLYLDRAALGVASVGEVSADGASASAGAMHGDDAAAPDGVASIVGDGDTAAVDAPATLSPRHRLYRSLLLSPALYQADDPEAFALLSTTDRRQRIADDLRDTLGWDLEVTGSYAALLRPGATETSLQYLFPARSARNHVALLLFAKLQEMVAAGDLTPDMYDRVRLPEAQLVALVSTLRDDHRDAWGKTVGRMGAGQLTTELLETLREWELVDGPDKDGQLQFLPLAARFRGTYERSEAGTG